VGGGWDISYTVRWRVPIICKMSLAGRRTTRAEMVFSHPQLLWPLGRIPSHGSFVDLDLFLPDPALSLIPDQIRKSGFGSSILSNRYLHRGLKTFICPSRSLHRRHRIKYRYCTWLFKFCFIKSYKTDLFGIFRIWIRIWIRIRTSKSGSIILLQNVYGTWPFSESCR
jgi:hypothetical protein